jgi:hypothetical protein
MPANWVDDSTTMPTMIAQAPTPMAARVTWTTT